MWSGPSCAGGGIHGDFVVVIQRPQRCKWAAHAHCVATPNIVVCLQHLQLNASESFYWLLIIIFLILIIIIINTTFGWCCGIFLWIEVCLSKFWQFVDLSMLYLRMILYCMQNKPVSLLYNYDRAGVWIFMSVLDISFENLLFDWQCILTKRWYIAVIEYSWIHHLMDSYCSFLQLVTLMLKMLTEGQITFHIEEAHAETAYKCPHE